MNMTSSKDKKSKYFNGGLFDDLEWEDKHQKRVSKTKYRKLRVRDVVNYIIDPDMIV